MSFSVTDYSTNRIPIWVIHTNLPLILYRFQVTLKFSLSRGECLTLTLSLGVIPANIAVSDISLKTRYVGLHFCPESIGVFVITFTPLRNPSRKLYGIRWNYAEVTAIAPFRVIKKVTDLGTNWKFICDFLLVINSNLPPTSHRFRDIALERSKIAILGYPSSV